ncbi:O-linked N-acetylglucosamine transferase family protein [Microcoleus sp. OTE_8_concoct_300]|uniref:O-linked N-acetylglucosamine transferase family protein n=1 Tax=Microcoleus sp. OTE_8_concoct_300 TaxID=2964710 RepID=UPI00403F41A0
MDIQKFINHLPNYYNNWNLPSVQPKSLRFREILEQVEGMTTPNIMQLLNFAVDCMEPEEVYCEIGCLRGASLIGALLNHPDCMAYAIDNFSEFDDSGQNLERLTNSLYEFNLEEQVFFCNQDFEEFFGELQKIGLDEKIGVYFYDASYDYRSQILGLLLVKPFLADKALIVLGNANSDQVQQAILDFTLTNPQYQLVFNLPTAKLFEETFWNGISIFSWDKDRIHNDPDFKYSSHTQSVIETLRKTQLEQHKESVSGLFTEAALLTHGHRYGEAEKKYKLILLYESNNAAAWMNLGIIYYQTERYQAAIDTLAKSLELDPSKSMVYYSLGLALEKASHYQQAIEAYRQTIDLNPKHIDAYNNLGNVLLKIGQIQESENIYRQAIQENPEDFGSYQNLGNLLMINSNWDEAIEFYLKALTLKPRDPDILNNLGLAYEAKGEKALSLSYFGYSCYRQGNYEETVHYFQALLETNQYIEPNNYLFLASALNEINRVEESLNIIQKGIRHYPNETAFYRLRINTLNENGCIQEAIASAKEASICNPDDLYIYIINQLILPSFYENYEQIVFSRQQFIQGLQNVINRIKLDSAEDRKSALVATSSHVNFYLSYQGKNDRELQEKYGKFIHKIMASNYPAWVNPVQMPPIANNGKIRIGYISDAIGNTSAAKWMLGWLKDCDRDKFEIFCYHTASYVGKDSTTQQIRLSSDVFYYIPDNLEATCQQIFKDQLHILVFLAIGLWAPTTQLASLRLAPIQCSTWGHPVTSGLPTIDYFLSGDLLEPHNAQEHYTEQLVRLPNLGISYQKPSIPKRTKTRSDFQLRNNAVIYLSCQLSVKYLPQYDYIFVEIVRRVPQAQLVFVFRSKISNDGSKTLETKFRQRLQKAFAEVNLNSEDYCVLLPSQNWESYTSLLLNSDVFLDTLSFSGGHTTFDAVACNLPIVTFPGEFMRGRQSYGILKMLGVTDTIAENEADYIEIAVKLGLDPQWRRNISQQMSERHTNLYQDKTCVKALEQFYEQVVQERLEQQETVTSALPKAIFQNSSLKKILHVGCGPYYPNSLPETFPTNEWQEVRLDIDPAVRPDIIGSIIDMSAVPSESVDALYSSHNVEHVYYHQVPLVLAEFHRVLKPEGFAMILVPDIEIVAEAVAKGNLEESPLYISPAGPIAAIDIFYGLRKAIATGNYYMAHHTAFTAQSLEGKMQQAGFRNLEVRRENFNIIAIGYKL